MGSAAFTIKSLEGLSRVLVSDIFIVFAVAKREAKIVGIWDTGATGSAITKKVADSLGLIPTGNTTVGTAAGPVLQNTYTIDIRLLNGVVIKDVIVTEVPVLSGNAEALIGMDIITLGDFSVTNHNNVTCMSFRIPSGHEIDYVANPNYGLTPVKSPPKIKNKYTNKKR